MTEHAFVREVGLRDGLQSIAEILPTEQKIAWLDAEHAAGVREIEVSSFVPPKPLPQLADAEAVVRHALSLPALTVSALLPNLRGAERGVPLGVHELNFVLAALNAGARAFAASLGGLGGCPYAPGASGNIVTEDLAFMLEAMGFETGIKIDRLLAVRERVHSLLPDVVQYGAIAKAGLPKN